MLYPNASTFFSILSLLILFSSKSTVKISVVKLTLALFIPSIFFTPRSTLFEQAEHVIPPTLYFLFILIISLIYFDTFSNKLIISFIFSSPLLCKIASFTQ